MAGASSRYNARSGWLSATALFPREAHGQITKNAKNKTKGNSKATLLFFVFVLFCFIIVALWK